MIKSGLPMRLSLLALSCSVPSLAIAADNQSLQVGSKTPIISQSDLAVDRMAVNSLPSGGDLTVSRKTNSDTNKRLIRVLSNQTQQLSTLQKKEITALKPTKHMVIEYEGEAAYVPIEIDQVKQTAKKATAVNFMQTTASTITPLCPTLSTGLLYTLNGLVAGNSACYHFEVTQRGKTTVLLLGQGAQTDANLTLFRHEEDDSLTVVGSSTSVGNGDEGILALTEPGHYYWFIDVVAGDGSPFNFAAVENTAADQYELNDIQALATVLPDKQNRVSANIDSTTDVDYYNFTAERGQSVIISLTDNYNNDEWQLEWLNGSWSPLTNDKLWVLNSLQAGQVINVRVSPKAGVTVDPSHNYQLTLGSKATMGSYSINGESDVLRIPFGQTGVSLPDQAYRKLYWSINVIDTTGVAVEGAQVTYKVDMNSDFNYTDYNAITNSTGRASGVVELGDCSGGAFYREFYDWGSGLKVWWGTDFNIGYTKLEVLGGSGVNDIALGHICRQRRLRTEF